MTSRIVLLALSFALAVPTSVLAAPPNDDCAAATVIKSLPFKRTIAVEGATDDVGQPEPSCGVGATVWFRYSARADVSLELETRDGGEGLAVFRGECGALTELACGDDTPTGAASGHLVVQLRKGDTIHVASRTRGRIGETLSIAARKSDPRYRPAEQVAEIVRSLDPSPYGGSQGTLLAAVAQTEKLTAFAQETEGVFVDVGGVLTTIAHSGAPAPGGGTFGTFSAPGTTANAVYFGSNIEGDGPLHSVIFRWNGTSLERHLGPGDPGPGDTVLTSVARRVAVTPSGTIAFVGRLDGTTSAKLMRFDGATVTIMAEAGAATACGRPIRAFESATAINAAGAIAFIASLQNSDRGLFLTDGVTLTTIACEDAATPLGGTFRDFREPPAINALGEVFFTTVNEDVSTEAIWKYAGGATTVVATRGMVLATGETITRLPRSTALAVNAPGDVVFVADLGSPRHRTIAQRKAAALLPSAVVTEDEACPLGGTFDEIDAEPALSGAGEIVFSGRCSGGAALFRKPDGEAPVVVASTASATPLGTGFGFEFPAIDAAGTRVSAIGARRTLQRLGCDGKGCTAPVGILPAGAPIANEPGRSLGAIDVATLAGDADTIAFFGSTVGPTRRAAVLRLEDGVLTAIASTGDPLPGGVGTFATIPFGQLFGFLADVGVGKDAVVFTATVDHPTADGGIFASTPEGLVTVALTGDPAPRGGTYEILDAAVARGRSILFLAGTEGPTCVFAAKGIGKKIAAVACEEDPLPPPLDGTIISLLSAPTGTATDLYVVAHVTPGDVECLLRFRNGKASPVRCQEHASPGGGFYTDLVAREIGPTTGVDGKGLVFATYNDATGNLTLLARRRDALVSALESDATPAPASGGVFFEDFDPSAGVAGKSIVTTASVVGGSASSALIKVTLP